MPKVPLELYRLGHIIKEECGIWSQKTLVFLLGPFNPSLLNLFQLLLSQKIKIIIIHPWDFPGGPLLRLCIPKAGGPSSSPGQGIRSHIYNLKYRM